MNFVKSYFLGWGIPTKELDECIKKSMGILTMDKLSLLKEYTRIQACDYTLWDPDLDIVASHIQQELRKVCWLIEEASEDQIKEEIKKLKDELKEFEVFNELH